MNEALSLLPKLFFDQTVKKMDELPHQSCGSVIKSCKQNKANQQMEQIYVAIERRETFLVMLVFSNICCVIESFPELKQKIVKEDITSPLSSLSRASEWRNKHIFIRIICGSN